MVGEAVTAYEVIPVGASGPEPDRAQRVEVRSYTELEAENAYLRTLLAETVDAREAWHSAWRHAVDSRIADRERLQRAMRILSAMEDKGPALAGAVAAARAEIWRLDS